ncbi:MAG: homocysteine S-methyltransferase [Merismopedia sp. SIO2A8]|nr:homocysteine S-methyltransferase [Symploca sp. SIO2B6]NET48029.1 homocysteine S-methyltransferase [Merismopedia sp. SIO2A8]
MRSPFSPFLEQQPFLVLDGGLATELETRGYDLNDALWSARLLLSDPEAIQQVHYDYLRAGADCVITASYQATIPGLLQQGLSEQEAIDVLRRSVQLAVAARDQFWQAPESRQGRIQPLVAASVGPYGAYLADGSEYSGQYGLDEGELIVFHRQRWHILAATSADLLACETIPSALEARALAQLLKETPEVPAWVSFSCRDGHRISDGTVLEDAIAPLTGLSNVVAIGVNCTSPTYIPSLVRRIRNVTDKLVLVYPNSGEVYHSETKQWHGYATVDDFATASQTWHEAGAMVIGGCCRTTLQHISAIRHFLSSSSQHGLIPKE